MGLFPWEMGSEKEDPDHQGPPAQLTLDPEGRGPLARQKVLHEADSGSTRRTDWWGLHEDTWVSVRFWAAQRGGHMLGLRSPRATA